MSNVEIGDTAITYSSHISGQDCVRLHFEEKCTIDFASTPPDAQISFNGVKQNKFLEKQFHIC